MPHMDHLTFDQLKDSVPKILDAVAEALASADPQRIARLVAEAPLQGLTRLRQKYDVVDVMQEDRLLRAIIVKHVEARLARQMKPVEAAALHATVDVMLQQSVVAMVEAQKVQLRAAAERELKYLSFLSHDLNNNLSGTTLMLKLLREQVRDLPQCSSAATQIDAALDTLRNTIDGMRRLLEHERLRKGGAELAVKPVDLHALADSIAHQFQRDAAGKGITLAIDVPPNSVAETDPELIALVLQNLVGNAVKYSGPGTVRIVARPERAAAGPARARVAMVRWTVSVSDHGPGIADDQKARLFEAFRRGDAHGQDGVGLGLAIAAQAARLLEAELTVQSALGEGSTFSLTLPPG
jgi:signal transduction histidine kinase